MEKQIIKFIWFLFMLFNSQIVFAETIKVAVIDTGFDFESEWEENPTFCEKHKDFTGYGIQDIHGHGTHIAGLISKYADDADYCLLIIKFFHNGTAEINSAITSTKAIKYAIEQKADLINLSYSGEFFDKQECNAIKKALDNNIIVVAAAGNNSKNLGENSFYPALCDERVIVVGSLNRQMNRLPSSNFGEKIDIYEIGESLLSLGLAGTYITSSGTSQAAAVVTGKLTKKLYKVKEKTKWKNLAKILKNY